MCEEGKYLAQGHPAREVGGLGVKPESLGIITRLHR